MPTIHIDLCPVCKSKELNYVFHCKDHLATGEEFAIFQCKQCGFEFTQDYPDAGEIEKYYDAPEYISHSNTNKGIINSLYHLVRKRSLHSKAKLISKYASQKGMLLDVGTGTGYFLNRMRKDSWIVTGIEKSPMARRYAKHKFNLNIQDSDYLFKLLPSTKDVITMWHVLEHMDRVNQVMAKLNSILKPDGFAFIALPNKNSIDAQFYKQDWAAYDVPRHLWHFSPDSFKQIAENHNFELVDIKPMYFDVFYISMLSQKYRKTFLASICGLLRGGYFSLRSYGQVDKCSSVIYILKKKQKNITI